MVQHVVQHKTGLPLCFGGVADAWYVCAAAVAAVAAAAAAGAGA
jgi:hypothetical protein